jgi:hypothetical protein
MGGDSLADYGADFLQMSYLPHGLCILRVAALDCVISMVDNGPAEPPSFTVLAKRTNNPKVLGVGNEGLLGKIDPPPLESQRCLLCHSFLHDH